MSMGIRRWIHRKLWGAGRAVRYVFIHPTCGQTDVEAGYLPEWGRPKFLCRRCGVAFEEARVRLGWQGEEQRPEGGRRGGDGESGRVGDPESGRRGDRETGDREK